MKHPVFYFFLFIALLPALFSCKEATITDSGIEIPDESQTELDQWIDTTFRIPYNVRVDYRWNNTVSDPAHITVPPREELVQPFLQAVLKIWLTPYIRVAETRADFMKDYICRELILVGSGSYNQGSVTLGLAADGYRITLYTVNRFDLTNGSISRANLRQFFRTMHHEFGHVLNQRKPYDAKFQQITGNYSADWTMLSDAQARELGFISAYARSADIEDFVEVLSYYITYTESEWQTLMESVKSTQAREYIRLKQQTVSSYMKNVYGVNLQELREAVTAAIAEVAAGNLTIEEVGI